MTTFSQAFQYLFVFFFCSEKYYRATLKFVMCLLSWSEPEMQEKTTIQMFLEAKKHCIFKKT